MNYHFLGNKKYIVFINILTFFAIFLGLLIFTIAKGKRSMLVISDSWAQNTLVSDRKLAQWTRI